MVCYSNLLSLFTQAAMTEIKKTVANNTVYYTVVTLALITVMHN